MKCKSCGSSWNTSATIKQCPFCGAQLGTAEAFTDIVDTLKYIISNFGIETYLDPRLLLSYVSDLAPDLDDERKLLSFCAECGIFAEMLAACECADAEKDSLCVLCSVKLRENMFMSSEFADKAVFWIASSLGWDVKSFTFFTQSRTQSAAAAPALSAESAPAGSECGAYDPFAPFLPDSPPPVGRHAAFDSCFFGSYYQNRGLYSPIEWLILEKDTKNALLISRFGIECRRFNEDFEAVSWEVCSLRRWLNGDFFDTAFSPDEQARIVYSKVPAEKNPRYLTHAGREVVDRVFLLSITEAERFFKSDDDRMCAPTDYAKRRGAYTTTCDVDGMAAGWWWLRTPGINKDAAAFVDYGGSVYYSGSDVNEPFGTVRPVIRIKL